MDTKLNPGKFDCYKKAEDDEPMFVLLARDPYASTLVRYWADHERAMNGGSTDKSKEATKCAEMMDHWRLMQQMDL